MGGVGGVGLRGRGGGGGVGGILSHLVFVVGGTLVLLVVFLLWERVRERYRCCFLCPFGGQDTLEE